MAKQNLDAKQLLLLAAALRDDRLVQLLNTVAFRQALAGLKNDAKSSDKELSKVSKQQLAVLQAAMKNPRLARALSQVALSGEISEVYDEVHNTKQGEPGRGIEKMYIENNTLYVEFTDGEKRVVGENLKGEPGVPGHPGEPGSQYIFSEEDQKELFEKAVAYISARVKTPEKGSDYFTYADIEAFEANLLAELNPKIDASIAEKIDAVIELVKNQIAAATSSSAAVISEQLSDEFDTKLPEKISNYIEEHQLEIEQIRGLREALNKKVVGNGYPVARGSVFTVKKAGVQAGTKSNINFIEGSSISITAVENGNDIDVTIASTFSITSSDDVPEGSTNLYFTDERVDDRVANLLQPGTNITSITYDDASNTLTINAADQGITLDTQANVKTTNTSGENSFTTDTKEEYIEDGTDFWLHQLPLIKDRTGSNGNPGPYDGQPRNYHPDFISGVNVYNSKLVNVRLGPADVNPQSFQLKGATANSLEEAQIYLNGDWRTFLTGVRLRQDSNTQLEYNIDGTDIWVDITDGNSNNTGIDGRPVIQDWQNDPGAGSVRRIFKSVVYDALGYAPTGEKEGVRGVQVQAADLDKADFLGQLYQGEIIVVTDDLSASKEMTTLMFPKVDAPTQSQLVPVQLQHITTVTASSVTLDTSYYTVLCDTSSNSITINLPAAADYQGFIYNIKLIDATNSVTIDGNGSETIDGSTTKSITTLYDTVRIQCDGSNWHII